MKKKRKEEKVLIDAIETKGVVQHTRANNKIKVPIGFREVFAAFSALILIVSIFLFVSGGEPINEESAWRLIVGSLFIFLLPGMIWGELLRFRSEHLYITIAKSFLLTLAISIVFIPIPFFFAATIRLWVWLMIAVTLSGMVMLYYRLSKDDTLVFIGVVKDLFIKPIKENLVLFLQLFIIALITFGAYRWGEDIGSVSGEKILHMTFLRYYFSMPMSLLDLSLTKGAPPPNFVNLWEYLLAGWSMLINTDPLYVFYRCRFVIPLLGFSGMYLLVNSIFTDRKRTDVVFTGVFLMCLGGFVFLSPSLYDWIKGEEFRRVFSFMGTAHHADSASDLLVAIGAGVVFLSVREPTWRNVVLLCSILIASFLWHPREFFQSAIYAGILGLTLIVIPSEDKLKKLKKWIKVMLVFFIIAVIFYALMKAFIPPQSHGYDEFKIKEVALKYAFDIEHITGIRNLFRFPTMFTLSSTHEPNVFLSSHSMFERALKEWNFMPMLILTALAIPILFYFGDRHSKKIAMFTFLLWFLVLSWNFTMLLFIVLTYSEIHMSTIRISYLFAYILISDAIYLLAVRFFKEGTALSKNLIPLGLFFAIGIIIAIWWLLNAPFIQILVYPLTLIVWLSVIVMYVKYKAFDFNKTIYITKDRALVYATICMIVFFIPILGQEYIKLAGEVVNGKRQTVYWHGENNPFGFSPQLLSFMKNVEPKKTFIVNPAGMDCIFVYYPQYVAVPPKIIGTIISAYEEQDATSFGLNPIFNQRVAHGVGSLNVKDLSDLKPIFHDDFSVWRANGIVQWSQIHKVTSPLSVLHVSDFNPNFIMMRQANNNEYYIRISYEKGKYVVVNKEHLFIGYFFKRASNQQTSDFITFRLKARADSNMSRPVRVIAFDEVQDFGARDREGETIEIKDDMWKEYIVTKRIRTENIAIGAMIGWTITDKQGWVDIKDPKIYIYSASTPVGQRLVNADINDIMDYNAIIAWISKYSADYILINKRYYDTMKRFVNTYSMDFKTVFDSPSTKELIIRNQSAKKP